MGAAVGVALDEFEIIVHKLVAVVGADADSRVRHRNAVLILNVDVQCSGAKGEVPHQIIFHGHVVAFAPDVEVAAGVLRARVVVGIVPAPHVDSVQVVPHRRAQPIPAQGVGVVAVGIAALGAVVANSHRALVVHPHERVSIIIEQESAHVGDDHLDDVVAVFRVGHLVQEVGVTVEVPRLLLDGDVVFGFQSLERYLVVLAHVSVEVQGAVERQAGSGERLGCERAVVRPRVSVDRIVVLIHYADRMILKRRDQIESTLGVADGDLLRTQEIAVGLGLASVRLDGPGAPVGPAQAHLMVSRRNPDDVVRSVGLVDSAVHAANVDVRDGGRIAFRCQDLACQRALSGNYQVDGLVFLPRQVGEVRGHVPGIVGADAYVGGRQRVHSRGRKPDAHGAVRRSVDPRIGQHAVERRKLHAA